MPKKSQYKRKPHFRKLYKEHDGIFKRYIKNYNRWKEILSSPTKATINEISDLLARLDYEPDENGIPIGDIPPITKTNPLVILDGIAESKFIDKSGTGKSKSTLDWKAELLELATLIWAGVYDLEEDAEEIQAHYPLVGKNKLEVHYLLITCDVESYWKGPGKGKSKADIKRAWEAGEEIMTGPKLADALRRSRGGT
jgi:hypothetical protein